MKKYLPIEANPSTFWYPFIDTLMKQKNREEFITLILDDSNTLFEENARAEKWHMQEAFVASIVDLRRLNISMILSCHETNLMYYKVRRRSDFVIYLRGAYPDEKMSRLQVMLPSKLSIGQGLIEDPFVEFGLLPWDRLPNQPGLINVIGCENNA